jgi:hypothetical protein
LGAVKAGRSAGAAGLLLTDWGDNGHWQQLPISYPGYLFAAGASWNPEAAGDLDIKAGLSRHIFRDDTENAANALIILENLYETGIVHFRNASMLAVLLLIDLHQYHVEELKRFRGYNFFREQEGIADVLSLLGKADIQAEDARLVNEELCFTADLMAHATHLGRARFATPALAVSQIPTSVRKNLSAELAALINGYKELWLKRSRPGGLNQSLGRMLALKASYLQE